MKKRYTFTLDEQPMEELQEMLKSKGVSSSAYVNSMVREQVSVMKMVESSGGAAKMPVGDFFALFSRLMKGMTA